MPSHLRHGHGHFGSPVHAVLGADERLRYRCVSRHSGGDCGPFLPPSIPPAFGYRRKVQILLVVHHLRQVRDLSALATTALLMPKRLFGKAFKSFVKPQEVTFVGCENIHLAHAGVLEA